MKKERKETQIDRNSQLSPMNDQPIDPLVRKLAPLIPSSLIKDGTSTSGTRRWSLMEISPASRFPTSRIGPRSLISSFERAAGLDRSSAVANNSIAPLIRLLEHLLKRVLDTALLYPRAG